MQHKHDCCWSHSAAVMSMLTVGKQAHLSVEGVQLLMLLRSLKFSYAKSCQCIQQLLSQSCNISVCKRLFCLGHCRGKQAMIDASCLRRHRLICTLVGNRSIPACTFKSGIMLAGVLSACAVTAAPPRQSGPDATAVSGAADCKLLSACTVQIGPPRDPLSSLWGHA